MNKDFTQGLLFGSVGLLGLEAITFIAAATVSISRERRQRAVQKLNTPPESKPEPKPGLHLVQSNETPPR